MKLSPINSIPETQEDFLAHFANMDPPLKLLNTTVDAEMLKADYEQKALACFIPNVQNFISKVDKGVSITLNAQTEAQLYFKFPIAADRFLGFLSLNERTKEAVKKQLVALHMNSKGEVIEARGLSIEDELNDLDLFINSRKELKVIQTKLRKNEKGSLIFEKAEELAYEIEKEELKEKKTSEIRDINKHPVERYQNLPGGLVYRAMFDATGLTKANVWDGLASYKSIEDFFKDKPQILKNGQPVDLVGVMGGVDLGKFLLIEIEHDNNFIMNIAEKLKLWAKIFLN